ncbi:zinc-binding alcohol dehydrogenase [Streptomyces longwoodensis]|uniref:zinc-dependent alcohol dehydrogenase n=1 Tax=Streptomyces longwoodensis TaxID=68231 RepID=UPI003408AB9E
MGTDDGMVLSVVFTGRDEVRVERAPAPRPGPGEFTVRVNVSLVSAGTEGIVLGRLFEPGTHWDQWVRYPFVPGYSAVGTVLELGEGTDRVRVGDRVALRRPHASVLSVPAAEDVYRVPDAVTDEEAAWFHLATIAQVGVRRAEHRLGDRVAVIGLGPVGQLAVQYARLSGAAEVFAVDPVRSRVDLATANGATVGLALPADEAAAAIRRATDDEGADVVYDVTGAAPVFAAAQHAVRRFGRLVLLGDSGTPSAQSLTPALITNGLSVVGAHDMHGEFAADDRDPWNNLRMGELFFRYLERGVMNTSSLISHRFPAEDAEAAYRLVRARPAHLTGLLLDWTGATGA